MASTKNLKKRGNTFTYTHTYAHNKRCHAYLYRSLSFLIRNRVEWIDEKREEKRFNALHFNEFPCAVERDKYLCRHYSAVFMSFIVIHISLRRRLYQIFFLWAHTKRKPNTPSTHRHTTNAYGRIGFSFISQPLFWAKKKKWCSKYTNKIIWHFSFACLFNHTSRLNGCQIHFNPFGIQASGPQKGCFNWMWTDDAATATIHHKFESR